MADATASPAIARIAAELQSKTKLRAMEERLHKHMDCEDRRVKAVTEGILYTLIPALLAALTSPDDSPETQLHPDAAAQSAAAALCASCLLNAPPGFLEFLLCVPWHKLTLLYPGVDVEEMLPQLQVSQADRKRALNQPLSPAALPVLVNFLYQPQNDASLPPMLVRTHDSQGQVLPRPPSSAQSSTSGGPQSAELKMRTWGPMNNEIDHLLYCGADVVAQNMAGQMPLELVPLCGDRDGDGNRICRCMTARDAEAWECRSRIARQKIMQGCLVSFRGGAKAWLSRLSQVCGCWMGVWGLRSAVYRPAIKAHMHARKVARMRSDYERASNQVLEMRQHWRKADESIRSARAQLAELLANHVGCADPSGEEVEPGAPAVRPAVALRTDQASLDAYSSAFAAADAAMLGFVGAVQIMLQLTRAGYIMRPDVLLQVRQQQAKVREKAAQKAAQASGAAAGSGTSCGESAPPQQTADVVSRGGSSSGEKESNGPEMLVCVSTQAQYVRGWAESVLIKLRLCNCPGCTAVALQAVKMAHGLASQLFESVTPYRQDAAWQIPWSLVGDALVDTLQIHIVVFLMIQAHASPNKDRLFVAVACMEEWDTLRRLGLTARLDSSAFKHVQLLRSWLMCAHSDLMLAEALANEPLPSNKEVAEVVRALVAYDDAGSPKLIRPVTPQALQSMQQALDMSQMASPKLLNVVTTIVRQAQAELHLQDRLKVLSTVECKDSELEANLAELERCIADAAAYDSLAAAREAALGARDGIERRLQAQQELEGVSQRVRHLDDDPAGDAQKQLFDTDWAGRARELQDAMTASEKCNINTNRAKRLLRELQAYSAAGDAIRQVNEVMAKKPCGASGLRSAIIRLEDIASQLSSASSTVSIPGAAIIAGKVAEAKQRLEVERAAEALAREARTARTVDQLQRLEAAILTAKRVGAEALDPESYSMASEMRERLAQAFRLKGHVELTARALERGQRREEADNLEDALSAAAEHADLLSDTLKNARLKLDQWRNLTASEAKLQRALREGATTQQLSRAIQDAAAAGVKVAAAKRTLKVLQSLESAVAALGGAPDPARTAMLQGRIAAAEQAGVASPLLRVACLQLRSLLVAEAHANLESALKPHPDWPVALQHSSLKTALQSAQDVVSEKRLVQYINAEGVVAPGEESELLHHVREMEGPSSSAPPAGNLAANARHDWSEAAETADAELAGAGNVDATQPAQKQGSCTDGALDMAALRRSALATGCIAAVELQEEEVLGLLEGVDRRLLHDVCQQVDGLVLLMGRSLLRVEELDAEIARVEAEKAAEAKSKKEALAKAEKQRKERDEAERREREKVEAGKKAEKDKARAARERKAKEAALKVRRGVPDTPRSAAPSPRAPVNTPRAAVNGGPSFLEVAEPSPRAARSAAPSMPRRHAQDASAVPHTASQPSALAPAPHPAHTATSRLAELASLLRSGPVPSRHAHALASDAAAAPSATDEAAFSPLYHSGAAAAQGSGYQGWGGATLPETESMLLHDFSTAQGFEHVHWGLPYGGLDSNDGADWGRYGHNERHFAPGANYSAGGWGAGASKAPAEAVQPLSSGIMSLGGSSIWGAAAPGDVHGDSFAGWGLQSSTINEASEAVSDQYMLAYRTPGLDMFGLPGWSGAAASAHASSGAEGATPNGVASAPSAVGASGSGVASPRLAGAGPDAPVANSLFQAVENMRSRNTLNVHAAEFQVRKPPEDSGDLGLPNDLIG